MKRLALISATFFVAFAGFQPVVVQVRDVPNSPTIPILAWDAGQAVDTTRSLRMVPWWEK